MIRVENIHLENVGPFASEDLDFSIQKGHPDIHIFTGINGCGKTTILHAIAAMFDHYEEEHFKGSSANDFQKRFRYFQFEGNKAKSFVVAKIGSILSDEHSEDFAIWGCQICGRIHFRKRDPDFPEDDFGLFEDSLQITNIDLSLVQFQAEQIPKITVPLRFAAFGYSGYRFISSTSIQLGNEDNFNPLHQALEFTKKTDTSAGISNWIISRYSKAAIEESLGNKEIASTYRNALNCLLDNISALTENQYTFSIQTNPWKVAIKYYDKEVEFDVLPDGLRSVLSWMGDLLMRLDNIPWEDKSIPVNEQRILLMLDEIEVHLHPKWQYQILPLTQKIFPNAQIFITTHSPFILNSIDNAKIYKLKTERGEAALDGEPILSETGNSYSYVYENILDTHNTFGHATMEDLKLFNAIDKEIALQNFERESEFIAVVQRLLKEGVEVIDLISSKLIRLKRITGKDYFHGENNEKVAL